MHMQIMMMVTGDQQVLIDDQQVLIDLLGKHACTLKPRNNVIALGSVYKCFTLYFLFSIYRFSILKCP